MPKKRKKRNNRSKYVKMVSEGTAINITGLMGQQIGFSMASKAPTSQAGLLMAKGTALGTKLVPVAATTRIGTGIIGMFKELEKPRKKIR